MLEEFVAGQGLSTRLASVLRGADRCDIARILARDALLAKAHRLRARGRRRRGILAAPASPGLQPS
jgi:hypothetical protein